MKKKTNIQVLKYVLVDLLSAITSWTILFVYRKEVLEPKKFGIDIEWKLDQRYYLGIVFIGLFWLSLYYITGTYKNIYRRSRLKELAQTFWLSILGTIIIFFTLLLNDSVGSYKNYYSSFFILFSSHFVITSVLRLFITTNTAHKIQNRVIGFNTLLIGSNENAVELYNELETSKRSNGNRFIGFVSVDNNIKYLVEKSLDYLGSYDKVEEIIAAYEVEEVIIAIESKEHTKLEEIINLLEGTNVTIKMIPDTYDIISGKVRMHSLFGAPLVEINHELMPMWQRVAKRIFDLVFSSLVLLLTFPLFIFIAIMVKFSSKGPIFFKQKRVGLNGKTFNILKFRSMYEDAEKDGPQLSSENDDRITPWGKIMRKFRLDELPQFFNVIIGEMSVVGPRPEREFYIEQIQKKAPYQKHLQKVRPGITSWGMVRYGYAENVDEMVQRLKYDVIYIENMSLYNDVKVLIYTVLIVLQGRGK